MSEQTQKTNLQEHNKNFKFVFCFRKEVKDLTSVKEVYD